MKFSKEDAKRLLQSRVIITGAGKYDNVKVTSCNDVIVNDEEVTIANFNAITPYQLKNIKTLLAEGNYDKAVNQQMSCRVWEGKYKPSNGETVNIIVDEITNKEGIEILVISNIMPLPAKKATKVNVDDLFFSDDDDIKEDEVLPPVTNLRKARA